MVTLANRPVSNYRPPLRTRDLPMPPRWTPREKAIAQARLTQFVVLSMILHAIAIMLFGAPVGGSREGRAMFGSLNVVIREAYRATTAPAKEVPAQPAPAPPSMPAPVSKPEPAPAPAPMPQVEAVPEAKEVPPPPVEFPPMLDRLAPSEVKIPSSVEFKATPIETPKIPKPMLQQLPTLPERTTLPALEAPVIRIPKETPRIPTPLLAPMPTIQERAAMPAVEMPVIRIPAETPSIPAPLLQPIAPMQDRLTLPPVERVPVEAPPVPTKSPPAEVAPRVPPVESRTPPVEAPRAPPAETRASQPPAEVPRTPAPAEMRPSPTESPFRAPPPAARDAERDYDPTKPSLDLDQMRKRAAELTRQGTGNRAMLPIPMPPVEKPKSKLEQAIENARKPDCRDAYKGLGLLAAIPLIANEFGEGTCRW